MSKLTNPWRGSLDKSDIFREEWVSPLMNWLPIGERELPSLYVKIPPLPDGIAPLNYTEWLTGVTADEPQSRPDFIKGYPIEFKVVQLMEDDDE